MKKNSLKILALAIICLMAGLAVGMFIGIKRGVPFVKRGGEQWTMGIYRSNSPFRFNALQGWFNTRFRAEDVTDVPAKFVADPFLVRDGNNWNLFFEVYNNDTQHGDLAVAVAAGYTADNDVSARDVQLGDGQWVRGKSVVTFCPLGPVFVTRDEIADPQQLAIRTILNDVTVQESNTKEMIFNVAHLVAFCSQAFTWEAGGVLLTGTPHGTGMGRTPKLYMKNGDLVVVEVEGIGRLENRCRSN